jgi:hypothetical protein
MNISISAAQVLITINIMDQKTLEGEKIEFTLAEESSINPEKRKLDEFSCEEPLKFRETGVRSGQDELNKLAEIENWRNRKSIPQNIQDPGAEMLQNKNMASPMKIPQVKVVVSKGQEKFSWGYGGHG